MFDVFPLSDLITQGYGCTSFQSEWIDPSCPQRRRHTGIDFGHSGGSAILLGSPLYATRSGLVVAVGADGQRNPGFSQYLGSQAVCLYTDEEPHRFLIYGHCQQAVVSRGQRVNPGDKVALCGSQGNSTAPHLHLEARTDGAYQLLANTVDPGPYIMRSGGEEMYTDQERKQITLRNWIDFYGEFPPASSPVAPQPDFEHTWAVLAPDKSNVFDFTVSMYNDPRAVAYRQRQARGGVSPLKGQTLDASITIK